MKTATGSQQTGRADAGEIAGQGEGSSLMATVEEAVELLAAQGGSADDGTAGAGAEEAAGAAGEARESDAKPDEEAIELERKGKIEFSPEQQRVLDERIGREVAKRKTLEERLDKVQREMDRQRREQDTAAGKLPPVYEMTGEELDGLDANAQKMLAFLKDRLDGTVDPEHPEKGGYTKEQVRQAYDTYSQLRAQIPDARRILAEREQVDAVAAELYPDVAPGGPRDEQFQKFRKMMGPEFAKLPNARLLFAHMLLGESVQQMRMQRREGARPKPGADEPPKLPVGSRGGARPGAALGGAGKPKGLNLQRLLDAKGDINVAVDMLAEAGF